MLFVLLPSVSFADNASVAASSWLSIPMVSSSDDSYIFGDYDTEVPSFSLRQAFYIGTGTGVDSVALEGAWITKVVNGVTKYVRGNTSVFDVSIPVSQLALDYKGASVSTPAAVDVVYSFNHSDLAGLGPSLWPGYKGCSALDQVYFIQNAPGAMPCWYNANDVKYQDHYIGGSTIPGAVESTMLGTPVISSEDGFYTHADAGTGLIAAPAGVTLIDPNTFVNGSRGAVDGSSCKSPGIYGIYPAFVGVLYGAGAIYGGADWWERFGNAMYPYGLEVQLSMVVQWFSTCTQPDIIDPGTFTPAALPPDNPIPVTGARLLAEASKVVVAESAGLLPLLPEPVFIFPPDGPPEGGYIPSADALQEVQDMLTEDYQNWVPFEVPEIPFPVSTGEYDFCGSHWSLEAAKLFDFSSITPVLWSIVAVGILFRGGGKKGHRKHLYRFGG